MIRRKTGTGKHYRTFCPGSLLVPAGYGKISYEWTIQGQKKSMTVPLGINNKARKFTYIYDGTGKQVGMDVTLESNIEGGSQTALDTTTGDGDGDTHFTYDDNKNRISLKNKNGDTYYFVYDPTASIPAVVYEQGPKYRYVNVREPDGALVSREKYQDDARIGSYTYHFDGLGSTRAITDEYGAVVDRYDYDAWGNEPMPFTHLADNPGNQGTDTCFEVLL